MDLHFFLKSALNSRNTYDYAITKYVIKSTIIKMQMPCRGFDGDYVILFILFMSHVGCYFPFLHNNLILRILSKKKKRFYKKKVYLHYVLCVGGYKFLKIN